MKKLQRLLLAGIVGFGVSMVGVSSLVADGEPSTPPTPPPVKEGEKPIIKPGDADVSKGLPDQPRLADEIKKMLEDFRNDRDARAAELKKLRETIMGATKDQKEEIRNKVRAILEAQKVDVEHIKQVVREQVRERMEQLGKDLPNRKEILDAAKEKIKEQKPRSRGE